MYENEKVDGAADGKGGARESESERDLYDRKVQRVAAGDKVVAGCVCANRGRPSARAVDRGASWET